MNFKDKLLLLKHAATWGEAGKNLMAPFSKAKQELDYGNYQDTYEPFKDTARNRFRKQYLNNPTWSTTPGMIADTGLSLLEDVGVPLGRAAKGLVRGVPDAARGVKQVAENTFNAGKSGVNYIADIAKGITSSAPQAKAQELVKSRGMDIKAIKPKSVLPSGQRIPERVK